MRAWASTVGCGLPMTDKCALLAEQYLVHPATVSDVLSNRNWYDPSYQPDEMQMTPAAVTLALVRVLTA